MKKVIIFVLLVALSAMPGTSLAANLADYTIKDAVFGYWYIGEWDKLALDVTIPANGGSADVLKSLSVQNNGTAKYAQGLKVMRLWADAGAVGFQGWTIDKDLGEGVYYSPTNSWYWQNLDLAIPAGGIRIFVSAEMWQTTPAANTNYTVQLSIPAYSDSNGNGAFDVGDAGVFVQSSNDGPMDGSIVNSQLQTIKYNNTDVSGPVVIMDNVSGGMEITESSFVINGKARDQGKSSPASVKINIAKDGEIGTWKDVEIIGSNYSTWKYNWEGIQDGTYNIQLQTMDFVGNRSESAVFSIKKIQKTAAPVVETPAVPTETVITYLDGQWIKLADNSAVYFLDKSNVRHAYPTQSVWESYFGKDFSSVRTVSVAEMAGYGLGNNVPFKSGTLLKIPSVKKVYKVENNGAIRWITTEAAAKSLFGNDWAKLVKDLPESFFTDYKEGSEIN